MIDEMIRVTRPGGLIVSVDEGRFCECDRTLDETEARYPGYAKFSDLWAQWVFVPALRRKSVDRAVRRALIVRGFAIHAGGKTVPSIFKWHDQVRGFESIEGAFPLAPFSDGESCLCTRR